tara:strand:- start:42 stop:650 length:609 start_codon:yes stop_codon:yes gene_type:complete
MIENLFPCPLGSYDLDRALTQKEIKHLKSKDLEDNVGNKASTTDDILEHEDVSNLEKFIIDKLNEYSEETYNFDTDKIEIYITSSWTNKTEPGEWHHTHWHQNSFISGVFYFDGNDDTDIIEFSNKLAYLGDTWDFHPDEYNPYNAPNWWMPAPAGKLYLFPSQLRHSVPKVEGKKDRWSLSFNTFLRGDIGEQHQRTRLVL